MPKPSSIYSLGSQVSVAFTAGRFRISKVWSSFNLEKEKAIFSWLLLDPVMSSQSSEIPKALSPVQYFAMRYKL